VLAATEVGVKSAGFLVLVHGQRAAAGCRGSHERPHLESQVAAGVEDASDRVFAPAVVAAFDLDVESQLLVIDGRGDGAPEAGARGANKLDLMSGEVYARDMGAWAQPLAFAILILACVLMGLFGADSRPGFSDGRTDRKDRWFVHSRTDRR